MSIKNKKLKLDDNYNELKILCESNNIKLLINEYLKINY